MAERKVEKKIGLILKALRLERGWDQTALAAASGVSQAHISAIEVGRYRSPKAETLAKLAAAMEVSITVFFPDLDAEKGVAESMAYWGTRGLLTPDEEEFLALLRDPAVGPELRRLARLIKAGKEAEAAKRGKKET